MRAITKIKLDQQTITTKNSIPKINNNIDVKQSVVDRREHQNEGSNQWTITSEYWVKGIS